MSDDEYRELMAAVREAQLAALVRDLRRLSAAGQSHQLRWVGPGLADRAWELLDR